MTEEIIIDCAFYKDGVCASPINKTCEYCKNIDVSKCYHKQLKRLEQENKDFEILAKSLYKRIEELEKENEALAFRERLYKADYEASEQENKGLKNKNICRETCEYFKRICNENTLLIKYRSALEEIKNYLNTLSSIDSDFQNTETYLRINDKIEEVLNKN